LTELPYCPVQKRAHAVRDLDPTPGKGQFNVVAVCPHCGFGVGARTAPSGEVTVEILEQTSN
jgi:hypothetical protein